MALDDLSPDHRDGSAPIHLTDPDAVRRLCRQVLPPPGEGLDLCFLLGDLNGHLLVDCRVDDVPAEAVADPAAVRTLLDCTVGVVGDRGSVAVCAVRHGPVHGTARDLAWQDEVGRFCRERGVRDLGFYVVGTRGAALLPQREGDA